MAGDVAEAPERVGRYEILLPIAKGGMATVYLARAEGHGGFHRYVALKLTLPQLRREPEFAVHLLDEAKLVAHIRHTNVVPMLDVGQDTLGVFLVMEYVQGDSLSGLMREASAQGAPLPPRIGLRVLADALEGLHAAHEHRDEEGYPLHLVHRDFSPQNVLVGTDGVARLTDFGIAKAASRVSNTTDGLIKGKMSYIAPEQARGAPLDRRCDLWAAGVIAWEIMCGRKLNPPNDPRSLLNTLRREPPRIRSVVPDAPEAIERVIASVLKLDRDERPSTASALARELANAARGAGMFAETHEVAEYVTRLAGPVLAERKVLLAQARRRRMASSPDGIETAFGVPSPLEAALTGQTGRALTGQTGRAPVPAPVAESDLSIDVTTEDSEPPTAHVAYPVVPVPAPMPVRPRAPEQATDVTTTHGVESDLAPLAADGALILGLTPRVLKVALVAGGLGIAVFVAIVGVTLKMAAERDGATSTSAIASTSAAPTAKIEAPSAPADPGMTSEPAVPAVQFLALKANAPVIEVRVADRVVDMVIAAPNANVELEPGETEHALKITARSSDGRIATAQLKSGQLEATLTFGASAPPPPAAPVRQVPAPARTTPRGAVTARPQGRR